MFFELRSNMLKLVDDHVKENLKILFVGFNPSIRSSETGYHFANPNNRFWRILHDAGLTPRRYNASEDSKLLDLGMGITNIVARPTKAADEITKEEYKEGKDILLKKIETYKPKVVCFVGKGVYQEYSGLKKVPWGKQENAVVPGTIDFVAPSSSGLVRMKVEDVVEIYSGLKEII
jgi:double-stranded uracil-DNA glycosylase